MAIPKIEEVRPQRPPFGTSRNPHGLAKPCQWIRTFLDAWTDKTHIRLKHSKISTTHQ